MLGISIKSILFKIMIGSSLISTILLQVNSYSDKLASPIVEQLAASGSVVAVLTWAVIYFKNMYKEEREASKDALDKLYKVHLDDNKKMEVIKDLQEEVKELKDYIKKS